MIDGYDTFEDVVDDQVRCYNQGIVMANIYQSHPYREGMSAAGMSTLIQYFREVKDVDKSVVMDCFKAALADRGLVAPEVPKDLH